GAHVGHEAGEGGEVALLGGLDGLGVDDGPADGAQLGVEDVGDGVDGGGLPGAGDGEGAAAVLEEVVGHGGDPLGVGVVGGGWCAADGGEGEAGDALDVARGD